MAPTHQGTVWNYASPSHLEAEARTTHLAASLAARPLAAPPAAPPALPHVDTQLSGRSGTSTYVRYAEAAVAQRIVCAPWAAR